MKALFVYSQDFIPFDAHPFVSMMDMPLGISCIAALLARHGHEVRGLVLCSDKERKSHTKLDRTLEAFPADLIALTSVSSQFRFVCEVARAAGKTRPAAYRVLGGAFPSLDPRRGLSSGLDAVCVGEGEHPTLELVEQLERGEAPGGIPNLWFRREDGSVEVNGTRPFLEDLDALPIPYRRMWEPWLSPYAERKPSVLLGRGCPYLCTYCSNHALRKLARGRYVRFRSPGNIVEEIESVLAAYPGIREIFLEVETIALDRAWLRALCARLGELEGVGGGRIRFGTNFRITERSVDEDVFADLERAGIAEINIGLESGSERVRSEVLGRRYSNADFLRAVSLARQHGMRVNVYNLIGVPGESRDDHRETVLLNREACPDAVYTSIFFPYPGTVLHDRCLSDGLVDASIDPSLERRRAVLDLPRFSRREIQRAFIRFEYRIYKGKRPFLLLLKRTVELKVFGNRHMRNAYWVLWGAKQFLSRLRHGG